MTPIGGASPGAAVTFHHHGRRRRGLHRTGRRRRRRTQGLPQRSDRARAAITTTYSSRSSPRRSIFPASSPATTSRSTCGCAPSPAPSIFRTTSVRRPRISATRRTSTSTSRRATRARRHERPRLPHGAGAGRVRLARRRRGGARRGSRPEAGQASPASPPRVTSRLADDRPYVVITADTHAGAAIDTYREYLEPGERATSTPGAGATRTRPKKHVGGKKTKNWDSAERLRRPRARRRRRRGALPEHRPALLRHGLPHRAAADARAVRALRSRAPAPTTAGSRSSAPRRRSAGRASG